MKIYLVCPRFKTGGPENIHLLCEYINQTYINQDVECYIYYCENYTNDFTSLYQEMKHVKIAPQIIDHPSSIIIVPEIYNIGSYKTIFPQSIVCIWWLSYTNACRKLTLECNLLPDVIHLFHSYYEYVMLHPLLPTATYYFLTDYINIKEESNNILFEKKEIVCYNGYRDYLTASICDKLNIIAVPIKDMTSEQVITTLQSAKIYIDLGFHPGKDHLPREAALCGCVIITNKCGSAAYYEEIPIDEKITFDTDLDTLLPYALTHYDELYIKQANYRQVIREEKVMHDKNVSIFITALQHKLGIVS